jgi:hypothetical protein
MEELKCFVSDILVSVLIPYSVLGIDDPLINPIPQNGQLHYAPPHHLGDHDVLISFQSPMKGMLLSVALPKGGI